MKKLALTVIAIAAISTAIATSASAQTAVADNGCIRHIIAAGQRVEVIAGLPDGPEGCLRRTIMLNVPCPTGVAKAEPATQEALRAHPMHRGEAAMWHFACIARPAAATQAPPAVRQQVTPERQSQSVNPPPRRELGGPIYQAIDDGKI